MDASTQPPAPTGAETITAAARVACEAWRMEKPRHFLNDEARQKWERIARAVGAAHAERVCHEEQLTVWSGEIVGRLSMGDYLRDDLSYDDTLSIHADVAAEIRRIVEGAFTHPEVGALDQPPASSGKALTGKAQGTWRPISTAPRNDTLVMLGWWCDVGGEPRWIAVAGWYEAGPADRCWYAAYDEERVEPTHWQPLDRLPAPPASSGQGGR